ncbi:MAG: hypothetical protein OXI01_17210 [Albidovulum sp.]|nr:hypothetical protein [Albidovulum sp.]
MKIIKPGIAAVFAFALAQMALAEEANVLTPSPVIHLLDNLDEADGLGWCIDTLGRGYAEYLHAHSCKPQGGDVQFAFEAENGSIRSVAFRDKCVVDLPFGSPTVFGLADCDPYLPEQIFVYEPGTLSLHDSQNPARCIAVGEVSRSAGPYMSRDLVWADCDLTDPKLRSWIIRN